jgi:hypothetical protein
MEEIEKLAEEMRESLSEYCINECKSFCCREGHLIVSNEELDFIISDENKKEKLISEGFVQEKMFCKNLLSFSNSCGGCPSLDLENFKCKIHEDSKRPKTCKDFPIFIIGKEIKISSRCLAKADNKFFKFENDAERLGYKIVGSFSFN